MMTLVFFSINTSYAAAAGDLSALLNEVHTMLADFTQTIYDNHGKAIQQSHGNMALSRPGKFRWEIKKPIPQLIIANETRLWIYDPDLEQVTIKALHQATGQSPALLLSQENATLDKDYTITQVQNDSSHAQSFSLIPRDADSMLASVQMEFVNHQLHGMRLEDHLGHITSIQFNDIRTNMSLSSSLFTFKKPPKVDVIDETKHHSSH